VELKGREELTDEADGVSQFGLKRNLRWGGFGAASGVGTEKKNERGNRRIPATFAKHSWHPTIHFAYYVGIDQTMNE